MDWIEFIAYPTNFKPISIDTSLRYYLSISWAKNKFTAKNCECILFEKVGETFSKQFIRDIKKYFNLTPKDYLTVFSPFLKYKLRFKLDKDMKFIKKLGEV